MKLITYKPKDYPTEVCVFPKKESDTHCNGKVHRQERYCQRPAGWGTKHVGSGRCKLHGGCNVNKKSGELRYSDYVPTAIVEKYEEFAVESNIDIKSLNDEIGLVRANIANLLAKFTDFNVSADTKILQLIELLRRLVETKQKVDERAKSKVNLEVVLKLVDNIIMIIDKRVQDVGTKKLISTDMRQLNLSELGLD